ncbi:MAG: hypothetical protein C4519_24270 [Desulfobacteraceae bacterium]|nr:MAG: hypothetical protein C4519_24270 [Desulfobacteraceae bacterium]
MRTLSKKDRILKLLLTGRKVHMRTLNKIGYRYGGRLDELREQGYKIETIRVKGSEFVYRLIQ